MKFSFVSTCLHANDDAISRSFLSGVALLTSTSILLLGASHKELQRNLQLHKYSSMLSQESTVELDIPENLYSAGYVAALETYTTGYVSPLRTETSTQIIEENLTENIVVSSSTVMYVDTGDWSLLNVRSGPSADSEVITQLNPRSQVTVLEDITENMSFVKIAFDGGEGYIHSDFISEIRPEFPAGNTSLTTTEYDGPILDSTIGTVNGPSGKETYYNLPMSKVVSNMHDMGYEGEYWVRDDGVKCFGSYILVAANLNIHPRGSIVRTSLGYGIVADSGDFAEINPYQLDIAVTW